MYNAIWVSYFQIIDFKPTLRGLGIRSTWESCIGEHASWNDPPKAVSSLKWLSSAKPYPELLLGGEGVRRSE